MERMASHYLQTWLTSTNRKPLVIRGARQVGKTWLVRHFAKTKGKQLIELNFENQPSHTSFFSSNDPQQILLNLSTLTQQKIDVENSLLFLDEIQAAPNLFAKLRWFAEDLPALPVITAGSLLEFVLADHSFSMPVGRISYMHLEPLSFKEFLLAINKKTLFDYLSNYEWHHDIPAAIHEQLLALFKEYLIVGGMPAAVSDWIDDHSLQKVNQTQNNLLATYRDDFAKYKGRIAPERIEEVLMAVPKMLGQKFVYSRVNPHVQSATIKQIIDLLAKARVCHRVMGCAGNGIPLAAEIKEKYFKEIFLDVGLCSAALGLNLSDLHHIKDIMLINHGGITEQVAGQLLRTIYPLYIEPALYCWHREEKGASAEIDYIIQHGSNIIPIEVKAGSIGSLKSLHFFMGLKKLPVALRINSDFPSKTIVKMHNHAGHPINYHLISLPFYLLEEALRLLDHHTLSKTDGVL